MAQANEEDREKLTMEDVFNENEQQLIEELTQFINEYEISKMVLQQQLYEMQGGDPMQPNINGEEINEENGMDQNLNQA